MALMERVATLLRANVNDLIDRAEDPEKMLKQLLLDMENQLLQVKTQVAIAIADQHLLEKKAAEQRDGASTWRAKAELAVSKGDDDLARLALERALSHAPTRLADSRPASTPPKLKTMPANNCSQAMLRPRSTIAFASWNVRRPWSVCWRS